MCALFALERAAFADFPVRCPRAGPPAKWPPRRKPLSAAIGDRPGDERRPCLGQSDGPTLKSLQSMDDEEERAFQFATKPMSLTFV